MLLIIDCLEDKSYLQIEFAHAELLSPATIASLWPAPFEKVVTKSQKDVKLAKES